MNRDSSYRILTVYVIFLIGGVIIVSRLVWLHVIRSPFLKEIAAKQYSLKYDIAPTRGKIFDRNGIVCAEDMNFFSLYVRPKRVKDPGQLAQSLSQILGLDKKTLSQRICSQKPFVWLKRHLTLDQKMTIAAHKLKGIGFIKEKKRFYPHKEFACQLLGIVNVDNKGIEGLESYYDSLLSGKPGFAVVLRDSRGVPLSVYEKLLPAKDGFNLILTLDFNIQHWAEYYLEKAIHQFNAKGGSVVVMDPRDGKILAMASYPFFDPNSYHRYPKEYLRNKAVCDLYEPGSVFKVVTLTAALEKNENFLRRSFFCENGSYKIKGSILHDWHSFGTLAFEDVFKNSSNIGVAKIAIELGPKTIYEYARKLGFGELSGIDFNSEAPGMLAPYVRWSKTSHYIIPIGQGVASTLLQLARGYGFIANGGYLVQPYLLDEVRDNQGVLIRKHEPVRRGPFLKDSAVREIHRILKKVVDEGTGKNARVEGVSIAGKTGTSQKLDETGHYSHSQYYGSFVGFFPADNPQVVIAVNLDEPKKYRFGGMTAAPLFRDIAAYVADYLGLRSVAAERPEGER